MTTDEATKKWCPMTKDRNENNMCISSNCMVWRWYYDEVKYGDYVKTEQGACGLAPAARNPKD